MNRLNNKILSLAALFVFTLTISAFAQGLIDLPKTGQSISYVKGDDGDLQIGVDWPTLRFIDNRDETITDSLTGLMWAKNANLIGRSTTYQEALNYASGMNAGAYQNFGYTDWRMPNIVEIESLINAGESNNAIWLNSQGFTNVPVESWFSNFYWSSSGGGNYTKVIWFYDGEIIGTLKNYSGFLWPVRSGQFGTIKLPKTGITWSESPGDDGDLQVGVAWPIPRFIDNGDGAVRDNLTGLLWTKNANLPNGKMTWQEALDYLTSLNDNQYLGYSDWRLPNRKELGSLELYISYANLKDPFTNIPYYPSFGTGFWTSTTYAYNPNNAWGAWLLWSGEVTGFNKISQDYYSKCYVWSVRGGGTPPCIEKSFTESTLTETLVSKKAVLNDVKVTGDFESSLNFTNFEMVSISTGSFAGKGFSKGEFQTTLEGVSYTGNWKGILFFKPQEKKIYLKGAVSGEISGLVEGYLTESEPGSGTYDRYQATWKIGRLGNASTSAIIKLDGTLIYESSSEFTNTKLYVLQTNLEGTISGDYAGFLNTVLTHLRVIDKINPYYGEGFSIISYTSDSGSGESWTYNKFMEPGRVAMKGIFTSPLLGIVSASLDETVSPRTLSITIQRVDLGLPPAPDLKVKVWGPQRVSPGQTIDYIIEYKNDGLLSAPDVAVIMNLSPFAEYISGSEGALYSETNEIAWDLGNLPAKTMGYLTAQAKVIWGLPLGTTLNNYAYIESFAWHSQKIGTLRNGVSLPRYEYQGTICYAENCTSISMSAEEFKDFECPLFSVCDIRQMPQYKSWNSASSKYDSSWSPILNTGDLLPIADALHAALASPVFGDGEGNPVPTDFNGLKQDYQSQDYAIEYSGGGPSGDGALKLGRETIISSEDKDFTKYRVSPVLFDPDILLPLYKEKGVKKVVLYQSEYDDLLEYNGTVSYDMQSGWDIEIEGVKSPQFIDKILAKLLGAKKAIDLFNINTGKQVERLQLNMTKDPEGKYCKDKVSIKLLGKEAPIEFFLQGNPKTGELFKQNDFANLEGIEVEVRDRSQYKIPHTGWQEWILNREDIFTNKIEPKTTEEFFGTSPQEINVARDPNELSVSPEGNVRPGDKLIYTINYENEGEGIAYGVYFTDTLEEDLEPSSLKIGPVIDALTGQNIGKPGIYNPQTRTITWFVGEVGSRQGGSAEFSVNVKSDIPDGREIINFATVYFPSVPEATRTNGTVNKVSTLVDNIASVTTASVLPVPNEAGWNNQDITITLTTSDNEGGLGVKEINYKLTDAALEERTISADITQISISTVGTTNLTYWSVDNAGNTETQKTLEIKLDKTPPTITAQVSPPPNSFSWNNTDVTVSFAATDSLSGIASLTEPVTVITEGSGQYIGGEVVDIAGNTATTSITLNIDKTPPQVSISTTPDILWPPDHKFIDVTIGGEATDNLSGIASTSFKITDEYKIVEPEILNFNTTVQLESWREGYDLDGRVYTILATTKDKADNQTSNSITVICPHDEGNE